MCGSGCRKTVIGVENIHTTSDMHAAPPKHGDSCASTGPCGLMDKALVFGTKDCRFESCQGHFCLLVVCSRLLDL